MFRAISSASISVVWCFTAGWREIESIRSGADYSINIWSKNETRYNTKKGNMAMRILYRLAGGLLEDTAGPAGKGEPDIQINTERSLYREGYDDYTII
jgi:hypothetical protein